MLNLTNFKKSDKSLKRSSTSVHSELWKREPRFKNGYLQVWRGSGLAKPKAEVIPAAMSLLYDTVSSILIPLC